MLSDREVLFLNESNRIENFGSLKYYLNSTEGHAKAWLFFKDKIKNHNLLTLEDLYKTHKMLIDEQETHKKFMKKATCRFGILGEYIPNSERGVFRNKENKINVSVGDYIAPHYLEVEKLMKEYINDLTRKLSEPTIMDTIDIAAIFHGRFEKIHPFIDGNGRIGRLVANYIMGYFGHDIIVFTFSDRNKYYDACKSENLMKKYFRDKSGKF